ncbi:hypothetical protein CEJ39_06120 [Rhodococcus pyridinivorans]|uniref:hypothetical protein n=1 Tax=Rhodococcus pyridinivorans TaxID=103816 RepID=UPI00031E0C3C|nr:hypothetical protein [Rhodococcus pyridinivorans]AWZ23810.1 hypothetical protein CEJ39_06120 [Rhodococcus pyridinivorans]
MNGGEWIDFTTTVGEVTEDGVTSAQGFVTEEVVPGTVSLVLFVEVGEVVVRMTAAEARRLADRLEQAADRLA